MKILQYKQVWSIWEEYEEALKRYVFKYTQDEEQAKDIVQDALLKVHKSCCSHNEIKNIRSWLFQIAHNSMLDFLKIEKRNSDLVPIEVTDSNSDIYEELSTYVEPLIQFLPPKYAIPLKMADIEGLKQQEIADKLNLSLTATKSRIQRARNLLREEIHTCFHTDVCTSAGLTDFKLKSSCTPLKNWKEEKK